MIINLKKFLFALITFIFILSMLSSVQATNQIIINTPNTNTTSTSTSTATGTTSLEKVENNICDIDIGGIGQFEKKITNFNSDEKSVTLTLSVTNKKEIEETYKDVEIFFVIDNSTSMLDQYNGITRKQAVINSANSLAEKLFKSNPNIKIGIVGFSSSENEGTLSDASLRLGLSNSETDVKSAITNLSDYQDGPRTNIEAGLTIAQENFSSNKNVDRYIVLLTDGVPNDALGITLTYSGEVATRTKAKLEQMENAGIQIVAAMINLDSETIEPTTQKTYRELSEEIFGTVDNPTTSTYFYIPDSELEDTIVNDIFDNLVVTVDNTLKNIKITDYFPQEIIDNFNFEYVASPNIGNVSQAVDKTNNSITWNIEILNPGEVATLSYKLTLKDDYDKNIIDKILSTNTKVDITAENNGNKIDTSSEESPTIRVKYDEPVIDNTVADTPIPQTGNSSIIEWLIGIVSITSIALVARMIYLKNKLNK